MHSEYERLQMLPLRRATIIIFRKSSMLISVVEINTNLANVEVSATACEVHGRVLLSVTDDHCLSRLKR